MSTQCKRILDYLDDYGSITPIEALRDLGIMRLAARIHEIRSRYGIPVDGESVKDVNRMGEPIHYTRYKKAV